MSATPRPLELLGTDGGEWVIARKDKHGKNRTVAHVYSEQDAVLIVHAVNLLNSGVLDEAKAAIDATLKNRNTILDPMCEALLKAVLAKLAGAQ